MIFQKDSDSEDQQQSLSSPIYINQQQQQQTKQKISNKVNLNLDYSSEGQENVEFSEESSVQLQELIPKQTNSNQQNIKQKDQQKSLQYQQQVNKTNQSQLLYRGVINKKFEQKQIDLEMDEDEDFNNEEDFDEDDYDLDDNDDEDDDQDDDDEDEQEEERNIYVKRNDNNILIISDSEQEEEYQKQINIQKQNQNNNSSQNQSHLLQNIFGKNMFQANQIIQPNSEEHFSSKDSETSLEGQQIIYQIDNNNSDSENIDLEDSQGNNSNLDNKNQEQLKELSNKKNIQQNQFTIRQIVGSNKADELICCYECLFKQQILSIYKKIDLKCSICQTISPQIFFPLVNGDKKCNKCQWRNQQYIKNCLMCNMDISVDNLTFTKLKNTDKRTSITRTKRYLKKKSILKIANRIQSQQIQNLQQKLSICPQYQFDQQIKAWVNDNLEKSKIHYKYLSFNYIFQKLDDECKQQLIQNDFYK